MSKQFVKTDIEQFLESIGQKLTKTSKYHWQLHLYLFQNTWYHSVLLKKLKRIQYICLHMYKHLVLIPTIHIYLVRIYNKVYYRILGRSVPTMCCCGMYFKALHRGWWCHISKKNVKVIYNIFLRSMTSTFSIK